MFNIRKLLSQLLFATCLAGTAGVAAAGPLYRVDIDTAALGSGTAFLDLYFLGLGNATDALATVTSLAGAFDGDAVLTGSVTGTVPGPLAFSNANGGAELVQAITLGGHFGFDVRFLMDSGTVGTAFGWALFTDTGYLGADGDLGNLFLHPEAAPDQQVSVVLASPLASVTVIPEPSTGLLLLLAGSVLLVSARLRKPGSL
jgi:hypothetical protein